MLATAILLMLAASFMSIIPVLSAPNTILTLSDVELGTQFAKKWGPATVVTTDVPGSGVQFDFTGLTGSGTGMSDDYPISRFAGGSPDGIGGWGNLAGYTRLSLVFTNVGPNGVHVNVDMNTGFAPPNTKNTYWQNTWTWLGAGETKVVTLDFSSAQVDQAMDDPNPAWQYPSWTWHPIFRLDETSRIGFQAANDDWSGTPKSGSVIVSAYIPSEPCQTLTLSDAELGSQFAKEWGPGTLTAITDIPGSGVQFDFTGLSSTQGTVVGDNFPVSQLAGGAWKTYGVTNPFSTWGNFSAFSRYSLVFTNVGPNPVTVNLKVNTGWTIPPPEYAAMWRDTFWQGTWTYIASGASQVLTLDFSWAEVYNAGDEQEFPQYPDGTKGVSVWRLDEVSDIGFQALGSGAGSIIISAYTPYKTLTLSDAELGSQFAKEWGPGTLTAITDIPGSGVQFDFTGLSSTQGTVVGDNFPVSQLAGGAWKDYGSGFAGSYDFTGYARYSLIITNVGADSVTVNLKMNTGWTNPPWGSAQRDTFWQDTWTNIAPSESKILTLDFCLAEVYNAGDEQEFPRYADGTTGICVWRLDEVSDIGFQALGSGAGSIIISGTYPTASKTHSPLTPKASETVTFDASTSSANGGSLVSFSWNFGDGNITTTNNVVILHVYGAPGTYNVTLTVADSEGLTGSTWQTINVIPSIVYVHDVAIVDKVVSRNVALQGWIVDINITVANLGNSTETFTVTAYYGDNIIDTKPVNDMANGTQQMLEFHWDTTGVSLGTYQIWANASIVPGEINTGNNLYYDGTVTITETFIMVESHVAKVRGEVFDVNVTVNNLDASERAILIQFELYYDKELIRLLNVTEGPFMAGFAGPPNGGTYSAWFDDWPDHMTFYVIIFPDGNAIWHEPFPSGNGTIATLTFQVIRQERGLEKPPLSTELILLNTMILKDDAVNEVTHAVQNGLVEILPTNIGDVNYDGKVDGKDIAIIAKAFASYPGHYRWNPEANLNGDTKIDGKDLAFCARNFGWLTDP